MEMSEQELPVVFSQMSQMFPNIPQDIIWLYVQQYSRDIEKCAQMLNLQNSKYTGLQSNLDECKNVIQETSFMTQPKTTLDNKNDMSLSTQFPLSSSGGDVTNKCAVDIQWTGDIASPSNFFSSAISEKNPLDFSRNVNETKHFNYNEPLVLDIVPDDDDDVSHSWRPNVCSDILCSGFFVPSSVSENIQLNSNIIPSLNSQCNNSEVINQESWRTNNSSPMLYCYTQQNTGHYERDIASYLHYQKSQMNTIRYEVIKAKIEQSDLKEEVERLSFELKEKMQSKSVQDIEELNDEIVQLRLECQCLCTDVDQILNDQGLLGEIDERFYEQNASFSKNTDTQNVACLQCTNSHPENNDNQDDSDRWQCPKCTFANHSAICVCEMCSAPKPSTRRPSFPYSAQSSCYCHPKEKSLSVQI